MSFCFGWCEHRSDSEVSPWSANA